MPSSPRSTRPPRAVAREKGTVGAMVRLYCADRHHDPNGICPSCGDLLAYAHQRLDRCPYGAAKPACNQCPVHCYQPARREAMREVMRAAGPKMLLRHPWLAIVHLLKERVRRSPARPPSRKAAASKASAADARRAAPVRID